MQVSELLDRAKVATGSDAETARRLNVTAQRLSDYRTGREACPWKKQLALCELAGLDAAATVAHMKEAAGHLGKKAAQALGVLALCFGSIASAPHAGPVGERANV